MWTCGPLVCLCSLPSVSSQGWRLTRDGSSTMMSCLWPLPLVCSLFSLTHIHTVCCRCDDKRRLCILSVCLSLCAKQTIIPSHPSPIYILTHSAYLSPPPSPSGTAIRSGMEGRMEAYIVHGHNRHKAYAFLHI